MVIAWLNFAVVFSRRAESELPINAFVVAAPVMRVYEK